MAQSAISTETQTRAPDIWTTPLGELPTETDVTLGLVFKQRLSEDISWFGRSFVYFCVASGYLHSISRSPLLHKHETNLKAKKDYFPSERAAEVWISHRLHPSEPSFAHVSPEHLCCITTRPYNPRSLYESEGSYESSCLRELVSSIAS